MKSYYFPKTNKQTKKNKTKQKQKKRAGYFETAHRPLKIWKE